MDERKSWESNRKREETEKEERKENERGWAEGRKNFLTEWWTDCEKVTPYLMIHPHPNEFLFASSSSPLSFYPFLVLLLDPSALLIHLFITSLNSDESTVHSNHNSSWRSKSINCILSSSPSLPLSSWTFEWNRMKYSISFHTVWFNLIQFDRNIDQSVGDKIVAMTFWYQKWLSDH